MFFFSAPLSPLFCLVIDTLSDFYSVKNCEKLFFQFFVIIEIFLIEK